MKSSTRSHASTSDYKQAVEAVEAHLATTYRLGVTLAFGSTLMEDILAAPLLGAITLQAYVGMDTAAQRSYDFVYMNLIVTIIMTKGYSYSSLRKWLTQNQIIPGAQAYTTKSNELVEMINSGSFVQNTIKQKNPKRGNCYKNKKNDEETVGKIIELSPNYTTSVELEPVENKESDREEPDSGESNGEYLDTSSETSKSNEETKAQSHMKCVFSLIDSEHNTDRTLFDPKADE